jgi:hypothetical protein
VCRLDPQEDIPAWAHGAGFVSITRTERELSIVIDEASAPTNIQRECGLIAMRIAGTLDFGLVGILARLTTALASADIPVFVISTFDTDLVMVRETHAQAAAAALSHIADIAAYAGCR